MESTTILKFCDAIHAQQNRPGVSDHRTDDIVIQRTEPPVRKSSSGTKDRQFWAAAAITVPVLAMAGLTLKFYVVQELLAGLLFVGAIVTAVFALIVAFMLCVEGIRRTFLLGKRAFAGLCRFVPSQNGNKDHRCARRSLTERALFSEPIPGVTASNDHPRR